MTRYLPWMLDADNYVPKSLANAANHAALEAAFHTGASVGHHDAQSDLDALLRELIEHNAEPWIVERVDRMSDVHADMGDDHLHASEAREDVVIWLHAALAGKAGQAVTEDDRQSPSRPHLRLVDPLRDT